MNIVYELKALQSTKPKLLCMEIEVTWTPVKCIHSSVCPATPTVIVVERNKASRLVSAAQKGHLFKQLRHTQPCSGESQKPQSITLLCPFNSAVSPVICFWKFIFTSRTIKSWLCARVAARNFI